MARKYPQIYLDAGTRCPTSDHNSVYLFDFGKEDGGRREVMLAANCGCAFDRERENEAADELGVQAGCRRGNGARPRRDPAKSGRAGVRDLREQKTTGGATSSSTASLVKRSILEGRELQRRGSGASDSHRRDLNDEFDKELMTDAEFHAEGQEAAAPPVQESSDGLWEKMSWMLDAKLDSNMGALEKNFSLALAHMECSLGTRLTAEEERRGKDILATNQRIDDVSLRIEALELTSAGPKMRELTEITATERSATNAVHDTVYDEMGGKHAVGDGWVADHIVVGGWRPRWNNSSATCQRTSRGGT